MNHFACSATPFGSRRTSWRAAPRSCRPSFLGRLRGFSEPPLSQLCAELEAHATPGLCPLWPSLTRPGGALLRTLEGHGGWVNAVALSGDGRTAVSGSDDKTLKVWDVATGKELRTLEGHGALVNAVALSGDGKTAVSGSSDRTLKVWDVATGKELRTLDGHGGWVNAVALSGDGRTGGLRLRRQDVEGVGRGDREGAPHPRRPRRPW